VREKQAPSFSLDWNCAIAVEKAEESAKWVNELIDAHFSGWSDVAVLQTSASENLPKSREFPGSYAAFENRLKNLGWDKLHRVSTPAVWGLTFWNRCYWIDKEDYRALVVGLWPLIGGGVPEKFADFLEDQGLPAATEIQSPEAARWRNIWCDVHSAVAHLNARRDFFVTLNSRDFQKRETEFHAVGLRAVSPQTAVEITLKSNDR
jgi:hypothetical protein